MSNDWSDTVPGDAAARRAGGRRRYHASRHLAMLLRRGQVIDLLRVYGGHGAQACIARALGVHRSTVCRDVAAINAHLWERDRLAELRCRVIELRCNAGELLPMPYRQVAERLGLSAEVVRTVCEDAPRSLSP